MSAKPASPALSAPPPVRKTNLELLGLRLAQFPGRMVTLRVMLSDAGEPVVWIISDEGKIEGRLPLMATAISGVGHA
jgi:hypothetical protein